MVRRPSGRVAHGAGACSVLEHARKNRWTISTLTRQLRGKKDAAGVRLHSQRPEVGAERVWVLSTNEDNCVDRFREMTTRKPIIVPPSPKKVVPKAKKETPVSKKTAVLSLADVLTFARRVADDDAAAVSATRLDDAVRRSRRRAARRQRSSRGRVPRKTRGSYETAPWSWMPGSKRPNASPLSGELTRVDSISPSCAICGDLSRRACGLMRVSEARRRPGRPDVHRRPSCRCSSGLCQRTF